ncbi:MAG: PAS domain S-box protein [Archaeoglobus sp.]|uniref:PAS domain S-box protein n=1 Tax=Archaeoglobus sp. TaxID=1872626 RepID=UPI001DFA593C|nr:PAS domain S-box protein [Archaeoglobus sp.]MBO8179236.1 PAS domain S-box protein [Archaeoglobus sp.]
MEKLAIEALEMLSDDFENALQRLCNFLVKFLGIRYSEIEVDGVKAKAGKPDGRVTEIRTDKATIRFCGDEEEIKRLIPTLNKAIGRILFLQEVKAFLDQTPDIILSLDDEGTIVDQNETARKVFGDVVGRKFFEICKGDTCSAGEKFYSMIAIKGFRRNIVVGRDITERVRLEKELEDRERRFKALAELSPAGIIVHHQGEILFVNDALCKMHGYTKEEIMKKKVWDLIHPDYRELARVMMQKRLEGERPVYELKTLRKDGSERWVLVAGGAIDWSGKKSVMAFALDITEKKMMEQKLKEREELFRNIFNSSSAGHYILVNGRFKLVNPTFERITGYSADELYGRRSLEIVAGEDREKVRKRAIEMLKGKTTEPYVYRILRKDGKVRWVYESITSITYEGERAVLGSVVDITELEEERRRLEELTSMLELINKTLRHDVLNALTSATAFLEIGIEDNSQEYLNKALESVNKAVHVVRNMRAFEDAVKSGELKCMDVREVVTEVAESFDGVSIYGEGRALADEGLRSVIENIVNNAFIHSGTDRVEIRISESAEWCEIRIADFGIGIPDEIKERIFEEGFKCGKTGQTGLGLFIAKKIVERYGGEIWVEDNKPKGSVFVIRFRRC